MRPKPHWDTEKCKERKRKSSFSGCRRKTDVQETNRPIKREKIILSNIKNIFWLISTLIQSQENTTDRKPPQTLRTLRSKAKDLWNMAGRRKHVYKFTCMNWDERYINRNGRKFVNQLHDPKLISKRHELIKRIRRDTRSVWMTLQFWTRQPEDTRGSIW